ncbi:hypothetical protein Adeg_1819 [Ammonifex degensii KC4]|uniref:CopZ zinc binding domain-containing protein n=1 Tax=Ammonifex degensii (strain DSM 10501 / KC4) TaxID=429009 RepID=C9R9C6_AMMDK|nr:hypothetical protein [Ammonifex degensii]ACX52905.1 hypothetical protein Adeg_1819 [Ammonifex degensii KC4]
MPENVCPLCGHKGSPVPFREVKERALKPCGHEVPEGQYYLCPNQDCPVAYFGPLALSYRDLKESG